MRTWASSGRVKIERAEEHVRHFKSELEAFRKRRPYVVVPKREFELENPEGVTYTMTALCIEERHAIPDPLGAIAADAIHNLSVALDHLWQRAIYGPGRGRKKDHFPAYESPDCSETRFKGKQKGRCKVAVDILQNVNAFEVGNPFWTIRCFDDSDKHDTMQLVACQLREVWLNIANYGRTMIRPDADGGFRILKDGTEILAISRRLAEVNVNEEFTFEVAFGDGEVLKREPVLPTLEHFTKAVRGLSELFVAAKLLD